MFIALDKETKKRVTIEQAILKNGNYICPICGSELIIRNGPVNTPCFAHKTLTDCDTFSNDMSEWHYNWQCKFPEKCREVVIKHNGETHRADICINFDEESANEIVLNYRKNMEAYNAKYIKENANKQCINRRKIKGYVIEFQHSPISKDEFNKRNKFYTDAGYNLIWLFDFEEDYANDKLQEVYIGGDLNHIKWKNPKKTFVDYNVSNAKYSENPLSNGYYAKAVKVGVVFSLNQVDEKYFILGSFEKSDECNTFEDINYGNYICRSPFDDLMKNPFDIKKLLQKMSKDNK